MKLLLIVNILYKEQKSNFTAFTNERDSMGRLIFREEKKKNLNTSTDRSKN